MKAATKSAPTEVSLAADAALTQSSIQRSELREKREREKQSPLLYIVPGFAETAENNLGVQTKLRVTARLTKLQRMEEVNETRERQQMNHHEVEVLSNFEEIKTQLRISKGMQKVQEEAQATQRLFEEPLTH